MWPLTFWVWLTLLNMKFSSSIHLPTKKHNFILLYGQIKLCCVYIHCIFLNHSSVTGHLSCFQGLAIVNSAAIKMDVQVPLSYHEAHSFGYMPWSGIAGSYGGSIFRFLRALHIAFYSSCTNLHSYQQYRSALFLPHPHQHLLLFVLLVIGILTGVR
jgi:hypothetical protein